MENLVEMTGIHKSFGGSAALQDASITLKAGSVHALMGENGAGKSTLMKILSGVHQPDEGVIRKNGATVTFANPKQALESGVSTVFQELSLLPNLTIAENMFLGREPLKGFAGIDYQKMNVATSAALRELGLDLDPNRLVGELSIAERQFVEIAHGIKADADIFVLDEPTAALNAADVEVLNKQIRRLKKAGKAIVYISHRMDEIFEICDTVTVLKDGALVGTKPILDMTPDSLIAMMVGRELEDLFPARALHFGETVLQIENFKTTEVSKPFSFVVRAGEIVALAGLEGQGQQKFARSLVGQHHPVSGTAWVNGTELHLAGHADNGIRHARKIGLGFVPEDRKEEGLFLGLPIGHNIAMGLHSAKSPFALAKRYREKIKQTMESMSVRATGPAQSVGSLSGGNQQKVLLGRYLATGVKCLVVEEPTRGVDIGAKSEIYQLLRDFAEAGGAALILSRETIELIGLCDRILVVHDDTIVSEMAAQDATEHNILDAALTSATGSPVQTEVMQ